MRRQLLILVLAALVLGVTAGPVAGDPASQGEFALYCEDGATYTMQLSNNGLVPAFDAESTMTGIPFTLYFSDDEGKVGELFYKGHRGNGHGYQNMPTTWCWWYGVGPGSNASPTGWMGGDWKLTH